MCRLLDAIEGVGKAADTLTRVCARHGAIADSTPVENSVVTALRRSFRAASLTPNDMMTTLGRMK
jgi:hypothetical protein